MVLRPPRVRHRSRLDRPGAPNPVRPRVTLTPSPAPRTQSVLPGRETRGALRPPGQELAASVIAHCHSAEPGAFSELAEFLVGIEMALAGNRLRSSGRSAQLRSRRVEGEAAVRA